MKINSLFFPTSVCATEKGGTSPAVTLVSTEKTNVALLRHSSSPADVVQVPVDRAPFSACFLGVFFALLRSLFCLEAPFATLE
jgi:hypothetical protein